MKAVTLNELGAQPALRDDLPTPSPAAGEVLVRVQASSVNPVDNAIAAGMLKDMVPHEFPVTLGRDFAGIVEQTGAAVTSVTAGDAVFGFVPRWSHGACRQLGRADRRRRVRPGPHARRRRIATAGAAPLAAVTAMLCVDALELSPGDTVLIVGATAASAASPSSSPPPPARP